MNTQTLRPKFRTTAAYLSGGICGLCWLPFAKGGKPVRVNLRDVLNRFSDKSGATVLDVVLSVLGSKGRDYRNARFTCDTYIRIERRADIGPGKYAIHTREWLVSEIDQVCDLIDLNTEVSDMCDEIES